MPYSRITILRQDEIDEMIENNLLPSSPRLRKNRKKVFTGLEWIQHKALDLANMWEQLGATLGEAPTRTIRNWTKEFWRIRDVGEQVWANLRWIVRDSNNDDGRTMTLPDGTPLTRNQRKVCFYLYIIYENEMDTSITWDMCELPDDAEPDPLQPAPEGFLQARQEFWEQTGEWRSMPMWMNEIYYDPTPNPPRTPEYEDPPPAYQEAPPPYPETPKYRRSRKTGEILIKLVGKQQRDGSIKVYLKKIKKKSPLSRLPVVEPEPTYPSW